MPVDFLTSDQKKNYGCYAAEPNDVQIIYNISDGCKIVNE